MTACEPRFSFDETRSVSRLGFGAMRLTGHDRKPPAEHRAALEVARRAVELGVDFIDTADSYALGANEELLAEALHPYPEGLLIATKAGQSRPRGDWVPLGRPEYLCQQIELSLRRLRIERIELFQLHRIDPKVPLADQLGALAEMRDEGKIARVGLSEVSVPQLEAARGIVEIASVQNRYNLTDRASEDVLDYCERAGIAFIPWLPIANGRHAESAGAVGKVAAELGATPAQVSLAWLLHRSPVVLPIPGTSTRAHLEENVAAGSLGLTGDQYARLDALGGE
ncbi:aldo/keto reductase [Amycolatopsis cihanbeyliensis]|uniref:Aryl-alcohol dehydrogenase-like predicted oxidoreductase n=1 Tax=Amycolatopsis cihanbeyliensis TaxID=1128664 RepID=A0A542DHF0_AMYCI|nr:aldo/keto reductase [Amycolatopsis cihanbeyliensis]TQJ02470.1 aryl-alcohol dehydrogenase-like predicted oxidoreductase [Amycolatopsis cihanbeyliensis]